MSDISPRRRNDLSGLITFHCTVEREDDAMYRASCASIVRLGKTRKEALLNLNSELRRQFGTSSARSPNMHPDKSLIPEDRAQRLEDAQRRMEVYGGIVTNAKRHTKDEVLQVCRELLNSAGTFFNELQLREQEHQEDVSRLRDCAICRIASDRRKVTATHVALTPSKHTLLCGPHAASKNGDGWIVVPLYDGAASIADQVEKAGEVAWDACAIMLNSHGSIDLETLESVVAANPHRDP